MIKFVLLALLSTRRRHGYELKQEFEARFAGTWPLNIGQVYTTLARMERDGLVESEIVPQEVVPDRRVYAITEDGRRDLKQWLVDPVDGPVRLKDELFV